MRVTSGVRRFGVVGLAALAAAALAGPSSGGAASPGVGCAGRWSGAADFWPSGRLVAAYERPVLASGSCGRPGFYGRRAGRTLAGAAFSISGDVWKRLHRPLHIPSIRPGSPCPTSQPDPKGSLSRLGFVGTAWGRGPAYPAGLGSATQPVLWFHYPPPPESGFYGSNWGGQKVNWVVDPAYRGPILIRGRQLDGPNVLRFTAGEPPSTEMRIPARTRTNPSYTRLRAPACYAYQIDGTTFSRVIVFEAKSFDTGPVDRDAVVAALRHEGLPMTDAGNDIWYLFGVVVWFYGNPVGPIWIFEFHDAKSAVETSMRISPDGYTTNGVHVDWAKPPHWYRGRNMLELYIGSDPATLASLQRVLGPQFAGS
jgi:hypothetical protein